MVSIIVPTYNEEENIKDLLLRLKKSFNRQDYEIIVIDDHSTDSTWEILQKYKNKFPLRIFKKEGIKGKAYSLVEGFEKAKGEILAMIDADLQYPPETIPHMAEAIGKDCDIVVANRKHYQASAFRKLASRVFRFTFGELLFGIGCDIQSGLKVFKKEVWETVKFTPRSAWAFDLEFLKKSKDSGFNPKIIDITFNKRHGGVSKISFVANAIDMATNAVILRAKTAKPIHLASKEEDSMRGAGVAHLGKRFVTHTTLHHKKSALTNFSTWQKYAAVGLLVAIFLGLVFDWLTTIAITIALLSSIYFIDVIFNLFLVLKSLHAPPDIKISNEEIDNLDRHKLPIYSILCPLYREAHVLPKFLQSIKNLDWPKEKLDVLLLLEEDDKATQKAVSQLELPSYVTPIVVPHSMPKTKPKACNYGLSFAKGEYIVIYDAEDIPDPYQLKKAYLAFAKSEKNVICLQAKLNYYNPKQNLLTKLFTAEYSLWFDLTLTGLQSINTYIPLGGTSNHFKTKDLIKLEAWDPFNVTEDADLGARLFKAGYKTAMIDSTTLEEANSRLGNWLRQRSRWIKGYMQTYLVHTRNPIKFARDNGLHSLLFQLVVGGKIAFIFINPILWVLTISYFALHAAVGPTIEALYPGYILYMAAGSLVFGNFLFMYYYMIGCAKCEQWGLMKYVFLVPFYWLAVSVAATKALYQLVFKPHFWEKTVHGLDTIKQYEQAIVDEPKSSGPSIWEDRIKKIRGLATSEVGTGGVLIGSAIVSNFFNFLYNAYLGRKISVEDFGLISLIGSFLYLSQIIFAALGRTVIYKSAYLFGQFETHVNIYWKYIRRRSIYISIGISIFWIAISPILMNYFHSPLWQPFILFAPVWIIGIISAIDSGFLSGNLKFGVMAVMTVIESLSKLIITWLLVTFGASHFVYAAIPLSMAASFLIGWYFASRLKGEEIEVEKEVIKFPVHFFTSAAISKLATIVFISFDLILAEHYLTPTDAGHYALLSLIGKMIFFLGGLFSQFIIPIVGKHEGAKKASHAVFYKLLFATATVSFLAYLGFGLFGSVTAPILLGSKITSVVYLLPFYGFAMFCYTIADSIVAFYQVKNKHLFPVASFLVALVQIGAIMLFHQSLQQIVGVMTIVGIGSLITIVVLHFVYEPALTIYRNLLDAVGVFMPLPKEGPINAKSQKFLVFNWRDTKHVWAGGAEVYIHEIAKGLVERGHSVTVFCGNDGNCPRYEEIDGVKIVRRGGFYTVYFWALIYYIFKFENKFDLIIDSENGIPFFTPLFVNRPIIALIHHVHQDVFRTKLKFPLAQIGKFLEGKAMPFFYKKVRLITVSNSSKESLEKLGFGKLYPIEVIHPGVDLTKFKPMPKTKKPNVLYLGRLKPYKSIDTLIRAIKEIKDLPNITLTIAGGGESRSDLEKLVKELHLTNVVRFVGRISEKAKRELLAKTWVLVQPSMVEGWGITVIEANASGTPVIASNVPGLRDSVRNPHTGFLVPWGDHKKFAKKIELLIKNEKLRKDFSNYSLIWAKQFSWENSTQKLVHLINKK